MGRILAWVVAGLSGVVVAGWALHIELLKSPVPGTRAMVVSTALMFGLLAASLAWLADPDGPHWQRRAGRGAALTVVVAATSFLGEHTLGLGLGVENLVAFLDPTLPAPETAIIFALLALALLALDVPVRRGPALAEVLALAGASLTTLVAIGHLYGTLFAPAQLPIGMAVHTPLGLFAIAVGIFMVRPRRGIAAIVTSERGGGALVRRLLMVSAAAALAAGLVATALEEAGAVPPPGASVLAVALSLVVIVVAILISGARIDRAEAELQLWNDFVSAAPFGAVFGSPDGRLMRVNETFARMHGWSPDELVGRTIRGMFSPAVQAEVAEELATFARLGRHRFESETVRRDGSTIPVVVDAAVMKDARGNLVRSLAYVQDITIERRAREDQARLASLVASADDAIVATDPDGTVRAWNRGAERLYGYSADEIIGQNGQILTPPGRLDEREELMQRLRAGDVITALETVRRRKDGTLVPVSLSVSAIRTPDGIVGFAGIARDISARVAAERALTEAHRDLTRIEHAALAVTDTIAGLPATSFERVLDVIVSESCALVGASCAALALATRPEEAPRPAVTAGDASARLGDVMGVPVRFHDELRGHIFVARRAGEPAFDARDRRVLEHLATHLGSALEVALLYQREAIVRARLDATLSQIPEGVVVLDADGHRVKENDVALAFRGGADAAWPYDMRWPSGEPMLEADRPLFRALATGETSRGVEVAIQLPGGELVPLLASASPIDVGATRVGAVVVFRDIRALKALERMREEWTSMVAHDLRQPINAIRLAADVLARAANEPKAMSWGRRITSEVLRLDTMISDLLDASKLEARRMALHPELMRPSAVVEDLLARVPEVATRCDVKIDEELPEVRADVTRVLQVLSNLLSNAVKYGSENTPIALAASRDGDGVRFSVTNHGPGIPADELPFVFDRFMRTKDAARSAVAGTGLGLYICKGLVEAHGGRVWVESVPEATTTFHVTLPGMADADRRHRVAAPQA